MTLQIHLPPDVEALCTAEANEKGLPLEHFLTERLIERVHTAKGQSIAADSREWILDLPQLKGQIIGSLSRRDIYGDR